MKVNYIPNTCDLDDWEYGEQSLVWLNDTLIFLYDHSDGFLDITDSKSIVKAIQDFLDTEEDIEFIESENVPEIVLTEAKGWI